MSWIPAAAQAVATIAPAALSFFGIGGSDNPAANYTYSARALKDQYNYNVKYQKSQYNYNLALQKQAQNWNEIMYQKRYQDQVKDLKKAGINPLYGLGTAPAVTSGMNSVGLPSAGLPDYAGEANSKRLYKLERAKTIADLISNGINNSALMAQTAKTKQETETEKANTLLTMERKTELELKNYAQQLQNESLPQRIKNELEEQVQRIKQMKTNIQQALSQISLNYATEEYTRAGTAVKKAEKENIIQDTKNKKNEYNHYEVHRGFSLGKYGTFGITTHPNERQWEIKPAGQGKEYIGGKEVNVKKYKIGKRST